MYVCVYVCMNIHIDKCTNRPLNQTQTSNYLATVQAVLWLLSHFGQQ
jgi:hypothetical protein